MISFYGKETRILLDVMENVKWIFESPFLQVKVIMQFCKLILKVGSHFLGGSMVF